MIGVDVELGTDCCGTIIIPNNKLLTIHTNRHTNLDGKLWGWIEGGVNQYYWSNSRNFNYEAALKLVTNYNESLRKLV